MQTEALVSPRAEDYDLIRRILNFLQTCGLRGIEGLAIESYQGTVTISGRLPSEREKWLCLECSRCVGGVVRIVDRLEVVAA